MTTNSMEKELSVHKAGDPDKRYRQMFAALIVLLFATILVVSMASFAVFNYGPLTCLLQEITCLTPAAAFMILLVGPKSKLKYLGLTAVVPLALLGCAICLYIEFQTQSITQICSALSQGKFNDKLLRSYKDDLNAVVGIGAMGKDIVALEEFSAGALDGYHYRLTLVQPLNPYFHKILDYRLISDDYQPKLFKRADGQMQLSLEGKDKKILSYLASDIFDGKVHLPPVH